MKGFKRSNLLFSLCGLNCALCPMKQGDYCPGCGGGEGNQTCAIARCSLQHGGHEYCFLCEEFPCPRYEGVTESDSFITHRNQMQDMERAQKIGLEAYNREQAEKVEILTLLLSEYNDGRRKSYYCTLVNLMDLQGLRILLERIGRQQDLVNMAPKDRAKYVVALGEALAEERGIEVKLRKK